MPKLSRSHIYTITGIVLVLIVLGLITYERLSPDGFFADLQNDLSEIQPAEPFYTDLDGAVVDLASFKGTPLIINSFATWMPFSKDELALLGKVKSIHGDAVQVIAINRMEPRERVRSYKENFLLPENILFLIDPVDHFYKTIGGYAMPETIFYASDGTIVQHTRGVLIENELMRYADAIMAK